MPLLAHSVSILAAGMIVAAAVIAALVLGREVLIPFTAAVILAFILSPVVTWLARQRMPRGLAVATAVFTLVVLLGLASTALTSQLLGLAASLESYKDNLVRKVRVVTAGGGHDGLVGRAVQSISALDQSLKRELPSRSNETAPVIVARNEGSLMNQLNAIFHPVAQVGLTLLFTLFLLLQSHDIRDRVVRVVGTDNMAATSSAAGEAGDRLSKLFFMQTALNAAFGLVMGLALAFIGVPNAALWGAVAFIMRFIPFIGAVLATVPPTLLAAAVDPGWAMPIATLVLFLSAEAIMGQVVEPLVLGRTAGLSPLAMIAAAGFWTMIWGPIGLILAAPITICLVVAGQYVPRLEFLSVLMGDAPALTPEYELYHRLLSDDSMAVAEQLNAAATESSAVEVADSIVLPALRLAARDHRLGRLDESQVETLGQTMRGLVGVDSNSPDLTPQPLVQIIPARGPIDTIAAGYIAAVLARTTGRPCSAVEHAAGLMALASIATTADREPKDITLIVSTVGGIDTRHLPYIVTRASANSPDARVLVGAWRDPGGAAAAAGAADGPKPILRLKEVVDLLGGYASPSRASDERHTVSAPAST